MWLLFRCICCSGVFFSSAKFPEPMQPFIRALPLTALNDALRAVMIDGASLASVGDKIAICAAWGVGMLRARAPPLQVALTRRWCRPGFDAWRTPRRRRGSGGSAEEPVGRARERLVVHPA